MFSRTHKMTKKELRKNREQQIKYDKDTLITNDYKRIPRTLSLPSSKHQSYPTFLVFVFENLCSTRWK